MRPYANTGSVKGFPEACRKPWFGLYVNWLHRVPTNRWTRIVGIYITVRFGTKCYNLDFV